MFRYPRPLVSMLAAGLFVLAACGGDDGGSSDGGGSTEETSSGESSGGGDAEATRAKLDAAVTALPDIAYSCTPEEYGVTSALRSSCVGSSSLSIRTHAWADAGALAAEIGSETMCSSESTLGEVRYLAGDVWAISAIPLSGSTAEKAAEIDAAMAALQGVLGGTESSTPCS